MKEATEVQAISFMFFWLYEEVNRLFGWGAIIDDCSVRKSGVECSFKVGLLFRAF